MAKKAHRIGPYSRAHVLANLDGRTREKRQVRATIAHLTAHVGGDPTATEQRLIERAAWLELHLDMMDRRGAERGSLSERESRSYLAYENSYRRSLAQLGLARRKPAGPSLRDYLDAKEGSAAA